MKSDNISDAASRRARMPRVVPRRVTHDSRCTACDQSVEELYDDLCIPCWQSSIGVEPNG